MSAALRSPERLAAPMDGSTPAGNQGRVEEAFALLGVVAVRIITDPNPSSYVLDLASRNGQLQDVWCRDGESATQVTQIASAFQATLNGTRSTRALTQQLTQFAPQGTTEGSLFIPLLPVEQVARELASCVCSSTD